MSCDEATLDITAYCCEHQISPEEVGKRLKQDVWNLTSLTCSVGMSSTFALSKIGAQLKKPDGLYWLKFETVEEMTAYVHCLPVRKMPFLGKRTEELLKSISVETLGDVYRNKAILWGTLPRKTVLFLLSCTTGQCGGASLIENGEDETPSTHSISKERTFHPPADRQELLSHLDNVCNRLLEYYHEEYSTHEITHVTLKVKASSFETKQRSCTLKVPTHDERVLKETARKLLAAEFYPLDIRLIGVKFTLGDLDEDDKKQLYIHDFFKPKTPKRQPASKRLREEKEDDVCDVDADMIPSD
eukprot:PhF_6_TR3752/c0_g1_i1/m.5420/K03511/POLK; DNA polymerase kappa